MTGDRGRAIMAGATPTFWSSALRPRIDALHDLEASQVGQQVEQLVEVIAGALGEGNRVLLVGNGGSAAAAQHAAAEWVGRFLAERRPLPAVALTSDTAILTAIGNDYGFDAVFERQVQALGKPGDVVLGLSTSGASTNVALALRTARQGGMRTAALLGRVLGRVGRHADIAVRMPVDSVPVIQELHTVVLHVLCEEVDRCLMTHGRRSPATRRRRRR